MDIHITTVKHHYHCFRWWSYICCTWI